MYTPEENAQIVMYRAKAAAGTLSKEELTHVVAILRQARKSAVNSASKKKAAAGGKSADDLLAELDV